jgi:hypothetical protein
MTATTFWVLFAILPATYDRPPLMVVERFPTQQACRKVIDRLPATTPQFSCMPSVQITRSAL